MSNAPAGFQRIVLGLAQGVPDRGAFQFAAEFAGLLRLDLIGLFIEDLRLAALAESPVLREFRTIESQWREVRGGDLQRDLALSLDLARREFETAAAAVGIARHFEVMRTTTAEAITAVSRAGDIVIVPAPKAGIDRAAPTELAAAAFARRSAVLFVPNAIVRQHGPVLAITQGADDPTLVAAAEIAAAVKERLDVITARENGQLTGWLGPARIGERMIVIGRAAVDETSLISLASERRVPVLATGRPQT